MNIVAANQQLQDLIKKSSPCPALISSKGVKTKFCIDFIKILEENNIDYTLEQLVEIKWRILNQDFTDKKCKGCNNAVSFISANKGFRIFCSKSCSSKHRDNSTRKGFVTKSGWIKSRNTMIKKYGVNHQALVPHFFEKQQTARYKSYSILSPSNIEYRVQGYERFVIPHLWKLYSEDDVIVKKADLPKIKYSHISTTKSYYPDGFIKSTNTLIEVKSTYTIKSPLLMSKVNGCILAGYNIEIYLYDKGKILTFSPNELNLYLESA